VVVDLGVADTRVVDMVVIGLVVGVASEDCLREAVVVDEDYLMKWRWWWMVVC